MMDQQDSDRLRRLETKITRLALALGIDPAAPDRIRVLPVEGIIEIQDLSPSLGAMQAACRAAGIEDGDTSAIMLHGKFIGQFVYSE